MKTKLAATLFGIFLILSCISPSIAQVTIGQNEEPEKYSILQVKDHAIDRSGSLDAVTAEKGGLLLPRVELKKKKELLPFATETDVSNNGQDYQDAKLLHTGLIVYNLKEDEDEELCVGLNQWDGVQWNCFQEKIGNAIARVTDCSTIEFTGAYKDGVSLNSSNQMIVTLEVTKTGAYTLTATVGYAGDPDQDNGYFFTVTGVFLSKGTYTLTIQGSGTPVLFTPENNLGDYVTIIFNEKPLLDPSENSCSKRIFVENSAVKPAFRIDCASSKVFGSYYLDKELTALEYIEVNLRVDASSYPPGSVPAKARLWTDEVNGIKFEGEVSLSGPSVTVYLEGSGKPNTLNPIKLTIYSNSETTTATCEVIVRPVIKTKKIVTIGLNNDYGYAIYGSTLNHVQKMLGNHSSYPNTTNFGAANSTVPTEAFSYVHYATGNAEKESEIRAIIQAQKPDIIHIAYYHTPSTVEAPGVGQALAEYVKAGGVLFAQWEFDGYKIAQAFFQQMFPSATIKAERFNSSNTAITAGNVFRIEPFDDDITNGPFGDVRGLQWGDDGRDGIRVVGIPSDKIINYSSDVNLSQDNSDIIVDGATTFCRLKEYNVIFIGDGGFMAGQDKKMGDTNVYKHTQVFTISDDGQARPIPNTQYGNSGGIYFTVYNSLVFGNIFTWALKQAELTPYRP
ncbi:hypothetical protein [uncultured Dysgonomonas sp.]|uniref:Uncharacterized protein n=1 Tax=uncultured Dysgonomonas sp. TaxID=206096 RepID=A0A212JTR4_9BACT|nr:hypothetical protein [uncultured Dysgonomonas sp.]SBW02826.1 conserved exported hypothetical protein [uncultured Dysgonomonas sp.]